jgi:hypothetical protein
MFADAKDIESYLVSEGDCFEQLAEMSRRIDGPARRVNGCCYETIYANLHVFLVLVFKRTGEFVTA